MDHEHGWPQQARVVGGRLEEVQREVVLGTWARCRGKSGRSRAVGTSRSRTTPAKQHDEPRVDIVQFGHHVCAAKYSMLARLATLGNIVLPTKPRAQLAAVYHVVRALHRTLAWVRDVW